MSKDPTDTGLTIEASSIPIPPRRRGMYDETTTQYDKGERLLHYLTLSDARIYSTTLKFGSGSRWWAEIVLVRDVVFRQSGTNPWEATLAVVWEYL